MSRFGSDQKNPLDITMETADSAPLASRESSFEMLKSVADEASQVITALEAMRNEHERLVVLAESAVDGSTAAASSAAKGLQQEKVNAFRKSLEKIVLHLDETQVHELYDTESSRFSLPEMSPYQV